MRLAGALTADTPGEAVSITELLPGQEYEFQVRAVDTSGNAGGWSAPIRQTMTVDVAAPSTPSAPTVAASISAVQVTHHLTNDTGHALENDLDHLDIYIGTTSGFLPDASTLAGTLTANKGMIQAGLWAVGTFQVESTARVYVRVVAVDKSGNASAPSLSASVTAALIDAAHIGSVTASQITAGTMGADVVISGSFSTASTGERSAMDSDGFHSFDTAGSEIFTVAGGNVTIIGQISTGDTSRRLVFNEDLGSGDPSIVFHPTDDSTNNISWISVTDGDFADEATIHIQTGKNNANTCYSFSTFASGALGFNIIDLNSGWPVNQMFITEDVIQVNGVERTNGIVRAQFSASVGGILNYATDAAGNVQTREQVHELGWQASGGYSGAVRSNVAAEPASALICTIDTESNTWNQKVECTADSIRLDGNVLVNGNPLYGGGSWRKTGLSSSSTINNSTYINTLATGVSTPYVEFEAASDKAFVALAMYMYPGSSPTGIIGWLALGVQDATNGNTFVVTPSDDRAVSTPPGERGRFSYTTLVTGLVPGNYYFFIPYVRTTAGSVAFSSCEINVTEV